jgi:hypothetical protein
MLLELPTWRGGSLRFFGNSDGTAVARLGPEAWADDATIDETEA